MWSKWLRFPKPVEIASDRLAVDCAESLSSVIAESGRLEHKKPYRGYVSAGGGEVRQRTYMFAILPVRNLVFELEPLAHGCRLIGKLELRKAILYPVGIYLTLCLCAEAWGLLEFAMHGVDFVGFVAGPIISVAMIYGWTFMAVRLNSRQEDQMVKALKHVMANDESAAVAVDLLSSSR